MQARKGKALVRQLSPSKFMSLLKRSQQQFDGTQQQVKPLNPNPKP